MMASYRAYSLDLQAGSLPHGDQFLTVREIAIHQVAEELSSASVRKGFLEKRKVCAFAKSGKNATIYGTKVALDAPAKSGVLTNKFPLVGKY
jgi:hypothetical protein